MAKKFSDLRNKMSPESRERAEAKAKLVREAAHVSADAPRKHPYKLDDLLAETPSERKD